MRKNNCVGIAESQGEIMSVVNNNVHKDTWASNYLIVAVV